MADILATINTKAVIDMSLGVGTFSGQLETIGDHDFIKITLFQNTTASFFLSFLDTGSVVNGDSTIRLLDAAGNDTGAADIGGVGQNSFLTFTPGIGEGGVFFIDIGEFGNNNTGDYSLLVSQPFTNPTNNFLNNTNDNNTGLVANQRIIGGKGADTIIINNGLHALGEQGNDIITGNALDNHISGGLGDDTLDGGVGFDFLFGDAGNDVMFGGDDNDELRGGDGDDILDGGIGDDILVGGLGKDFMSGGGSIDTFAYKTLADSKKGASRDVITDFSVANDTIDLDALDAKKGGGNQDFKFIGQRAFHHKAGELHFKIDAAHDRTIIQGDVNGDGRADFEIELRGQKVLLEGNFDL